MGEMVFGSAGVVRCDSGLALMIVCVYLYVYRDFCQSVPAWPDSIFSCCFLSFVWQFVVVGDDEWKSSLEGIIWGKGLIVHAENQKAIIHHSTFNALQVCPQRRSHRRNHQKSEQEIPHNIQPPDHGIFAHSNQRSDQLRPHNSCR